jgi:hypothetical protein
MANPPAPSARTRRITACDSRESPNPICKEIAFQKSKPGKFDYLSAPNHPAHSRDSEFFTDDSSSLQLFCLEDARAVNYRLVAAANDLVGKSEVEVRETIGDKFPKHIYHPIVCIGALIAQRLRGGIRRALTRRSPSCSQRLRQETLDG